MRRIVGRCERSIFDFDLVAVGLAVTLSLAAFGAWLDNTHINTANGLWKSVYVTQWKADFGSAPLDPSNYLYFPLVSTLCRLLDVLGVHVGETWRQMATVSALFAGMAAAVIYWLVRRLTGRRDIAAIAVLFHLGCAFFLSLAVMDEDIMPSYAVMVTAMALAAVWFAAPTTGQVAGVAALFTLSWLIEWRMLFPVLPPLLLALALSQGPLLKRFALILVFIAAVIGVALLVVTLWAGHNGAVGLPYVLWTGKGANTAWVGFSWHKLSLIMSGMGEYWLGGNFVTGQNFDALSAEWGIAFALQMLVLIGFGLLLWRRRCDPRMRTVAIVFLGTLLAGQAVNAYSQPEDPQMQLNVMPWLTVAMALLLAELPIARSRVAVAAISVLALVPLAYNVAAFAKGRGADGRILAALAELERISDPARTVYVYNSPESLLAWQYATWAPRKPDVCDLGLSPQATPKFKWISLSWPITNNRRLTTDQFVEHIKAELDCAFAKGYRVIASAAWPRLEEDLGGWMTLLGIRDYAAALGPVLKAYRAEPVGGPTIDYAEGYFEIRPSQPNVISAQD
jgi:hypothetical protein